MAETLQRARWHSQLLRARDSRELGRLLQTAVRGLPGVAQNVSVSHPSPLEAVVVWFMPEIRAF